MFFLTVLCCAVQPVLGAEGTAVELAPIVVKTYHPHKGAFLTPDEIKTFPVDSWQAALRYAGLDIISRSPNGIQTDYTARGSNFSGVSVLFEGLRINDPQTAHHNADIPLTLADIETIGVLLPSEAVRFGPDAIGAAVALSLRDPLVREGLIEGGAGNHDSVFGLFSVTEANDTAGVRVSVENKETDGFRLATDSRSLTATLTSQVQLPSGGLKGFFGYNEKEFGAYDFYTPGLGFPSREWTKTYLASASFDLALDSLNLTPSFIWRRHYDKFALDATTQRSTYLNHHRSDTFLASLRAKRMLGASSSVGAGIEAGTETLVSTNLGGHERDHAGVFLEGRSAEHPLFWQEGALRLDYYDTFGTAYSASVKAGSNVGDAQTLYISCSRSVRVPSFTELYYSDPTTVGNSALAEETGLTFETGYTGAGKNASWSIILFTRRQDEAIDWVRRTSANAWQAENISLGRALGAEGTLKARINACIETRLRYAYTDAPRGDEGFLYKYGHSYARHGATTAAVFSFAGCEVDIASTYVKKPSRRGWFLSDLSAKRTLKNGYSVFGRISNLFNVEYQELAGIPSPGRRIEAGLGLEW